MRDRSKHMDFGKTIDLFIRDMRLEGRITGPVGGTEASYRKTLCLHLDDCDNADPRETDREDVKETLLRWNNPSTIKGRLAAMVSFYEWMMQEGKRPDNPALQVRRPKVRKANVYRLTRDEAAGMLAAAAGKYEQRVATLGICHGLRNSELRGQQGRHYRRPGLVWVSGDIAKGGRERWTPVIAESLAIVEEIRDTVADDEFVLPRLMPPGGMAQVMATAATRVEDSSRPCSQQHIGRLVARIADRAGISAHIYPHLMRHAYADHVSRHGGVLAAKALLGHADLGTTQGYLSEPTVDELIAAVEGMEFGRSCEPAGDVIPIASTGARARQDSNLCPEQVGDLGREASDWLARARRAGLVDLYRDEAGRLRARVDVAVDDL